MSDSIKKTFVQYLKKKAHRITNERFLILDAATNISGHFDADELYLKMKNDYINVSRATVYKTLELMSECSILTKHNFKGDRTDMKQRSAERCTIISSALCAIR